MKSEYLNLIIKFLFQLLNFPYFKTQLKKYLKEIIYLLNP